MAPTRPSKQRSGMRGKRSHINKAIKKVTTTTTTPKCEKPEHTQTNAFFRIPPELQTMVLSYLPDTEISASRSLCQEFHSIVEHHEFALAAPKINHHLQRLQQDVENIKAIRPPTDANTFFDSLSFWILRRGLFHAQQVSFQSLTKWYSHLFPHQEDHDQAMTWALLGQLVVLLEERHRFYMMQGWGNLDHRQWFLNNAAMMATPPLDATELDTLIQRVHSAHNPNARDMDGIFWGHTIPEEATFPAERDGSYFLLPNAYRITPIRQTVEDIGLPNGFRQPKFSDDLLCGNLGLPSLPGPRKSNTFCYYVKKKWVYDALPLGLPSKRRTMNPLMRAAALAEVALF